MEFMVPISFFIFLGFTVFLHFTTQHKERMSLIEHGRDAGIFDEKKTPRYFSALKWGLLSFFIGLGGGIGIYIDVNNDHDGPVCTFPAIFIAAGLGLVIYYLIAKDKLENVKDKSEEETLN